MSNPKYHSVNKTDVDKYDVKDRLFDWVQETTARHFSENTNSNTPIRNWNSLHVFSFKEWLHLRSKPTINLQNRTVLSKCLHSASKMKKKTDEAHENRNIVSLPNCADQYNQTSCIQRYCLL